MYEKIEIPLIYWEKQQKSQTHDNKIKMEFLQPQDSPYSR